MSYGSFHPPPPPISMGAERRTGVSPKPEGMTTLLSSSQNAELLPWPRHNEVDGGGGGETTSVLLKKMNYIIQLLESQQRQKSAHVLEEVVLYSFVGIFVIFLADTCMKSVHPPSYVR